MAQLNQPAESPRAMSLSARKFQRQLASRVRLLTAPQRLFPDKRVWAHAVAHGLPDYSYWTQGSSYGELYPLELVQGNYQTPRRPNSGLARMQSCGINGLQYMLFTGDPGNNIASEFAPIADATWSDPDPTKHFMLAPCIYGELSTTEIIRLIREYVAYAANHVSCARINGQYVIWVYASQGHTASEWAQLRTSVADLPLFLIGDLGVDAAIHGYTIQESRITPLFPYFEASFIFDDSLDHFWPALIDYLNRSNRPYAGGTMPGYSRDNVDTGGYIDAEGTKLYRRMWERHLAAGVRWHNMISWDDMVECHEIRPSSMWNTTRADLTAFYAAKHMGRAYPRPRAELYITTPTYVYATTDAIRAEAMVINAGSAPVRITIQLYDHLNVPFGAPSSAICYPDATADATTATTIYAGTGMIGKWLRARAEMRDADGTLRATVTSAPIIVYPNGLMPSTRLRRLYYSIPSYAALPSNPSLSIPTSPSSGTVTATVTSPPGITTRFSEVLQNTRLVELGFGQSTFTTSVPMAQKQYLATTVTSQASGYYLARVIDDQERVGYSDPLYFS